MSSILEVKGLTKKFGSFTAVNQLDFEVTKGQVFGILGPNGSGKTTSLSMILTLLKTNGGDVKIFGSDDLTSGRKKMGVTLETAGFLPNYSAEKNLQMSALIKKVPFKDIDRVLELVDLERVRKKKYKSFSYGMKQRLAIAGALLGDPDVLVFDEPTNGLDPHGIIDIRNLITKLAAQGKTIIVASHLLVEMERVCTDIIIISKGKLIKQGKLESFLGEYETLENAFIQLTAH